MKRFVVFILIIAMMGTALMSCTGGTVVNGTDNDNGTDAPIQSGTNAPTVSDVPSESFTNAPSATVADTQLPDTFIIDTQGTDDMFIDTQAPIFSDSDVFVTDAPTDSQRVTEENITQSETEAEIESESQTEISTDKPAIEKPSTEKPTEKPTQKPTFNVKDSTKGLKFELNPDGLSYTLVDMGTASSKSEILIDGYNGLPVTKIGYGVFDNSVRKNTVLTKVTIGDYVEEIGCYAFSHCSKLTTVVMGDGVKVIKLGAFRYCSNLTTIKVGSGVEYIGDSAFYNSTKLASITLPNTVRYVEDYAFQGTAYYKNDSNWVKNALYIGKCLVKLKDTSTGTVNVKDGTVVIADNAIANCKSITKVVVPSSVEVIGKKAFKNCTALATLDLGSGIKYIGEEAFANTKYYNTSSNWNNSILYAGTYLLKANTSVSGTITVSSGTKTIASGAFASCKNVSGVMIPAALVSIGDYAFLNCTGLTNVSLGKGVKTIYNGAFKGCIKLAGVTLPSYTGWSVDGVLVDSDELQTKTDAAALLTSIYVEKVWTR